MQTKCLEGMKQMLRRYAGYLLSCPLNLKFSALIANRSRRRMPGAAYTYADTVCASYYAGM